MIAAIVVPLGCLSRPMTVSCLVPPRVEPEATFSTFADFFARLAGATFVLLGVLRCDIFEILFGCDSTRAVTTEAPQRRYRQRGGIRDEAKKGPDEHDDTDALFAAEVQSFLQGISGFYWRSISGLKLGSPLPSVSEFSQPVSSLWACPSRRNTRDISASEPNIGRSLQRGIRNFWASSANLSRQSLVAD